MLLQSPGATAEQEAALDFRGGHVFVGAGPGTGKSFLLVERCRRLRAAGVAGASILLLTFSRRAVIELRERLFAAGFARGEIEVRTFHGFAARVIGGGEASFRDQRLLDGYSRQLLLSTAIERTSTTALTPSVRRSRAFRAELALVLNDLGRLPSDVLTELAEQSAGRLRDVIAIDRSAKRARAAIGGSDIGELVERALHELRRPDSPAANWLRGRYAQILIDEFQDTDRAQIDLIAALDAVIFAVGDEAQSIYRFRGAGNDIVHEAIRRFGMHRFDLSVSQRCPPSVCVLASKTPLPGLIPLRSAHSADVPLEIVRLRAVDDEAVFLADAIEADLDAGLPAAEIAVLLRTFRPIGPLLIDELRRRSIAVIATGREELPADPRVAVLRAALEVLARPADPLRWKRFLCAGPLRFDPLAVRFASSRLAMLRLDDSLVAGLESICVGGALPGAVVAGALLDAAQAWKAGDIGVAARRLVRRLRLFAAILTDEPPRAARPAAARLKLVCDALAGAQRTATALGIPASCADILAGFDNAIAELALDDAGIDPHADGVRVLTVHAAKGLEFDRVFVADAVTGRFPRESRPSALLDDDDRALLARFGCAGPVVDPAGAALEEASLWYVALTRCKRRLTISFANHGLNGDLQRVSRFLPADLVPSTVTRVEREALDLLALRSGDAVAIDSVLAGDELAAAPAMSDYARCGPVAFALLADRGLPFDGQLSVGDAELWLQCPRRLFYKRFVTLPDRASASIELGSLIHRVLEDFHAVRCAFDASSIDVAGWSDELRTILRERWDASKFESAVVAQAAAAAAEISLRSYARVLAERAARHPFDVEAREHRVAVPAGQFVLHGRVDRIDRRRDGSAVVIDYKSGKAGEPSTLRAAKKIAPDWSAANTDGTSRTPLAGRATGKLKLQLAFYATAIDGVTEISYIWLGGSKDPWQRNGAVDVSEEFGPQLRTFTHAVLEEIASDLLEPLAAGTLRMLPVTSDPGTCTFCPYAGICPGVRDEVAS